jgi:mRNA interferase MazF
MKRTLPGELWRVDFGLAAKVRPALVISDYPGDDELALLIVIPHTPALRGNRWELVLPAPFLRDGAFHLNKFNPFPSLALMRVLEESHPKISNA